MKNLLIFSLITVIVALAYCTPFSSEEEVINQLLLIRENLLAAKQFIHIKKTDEPGMTSVSPYYFHPYSLSPLYGEGKTGHWRELSENLMKVESEKRATNEAEIVNNPTNAHVFGKLRKHIFSCLATFRQDLADSIRLDEKYNVNDPEKDKIMGVFKEIFNGAELDKLDINTMFKKIVGYIMIHFFPEELIAKNQEHKNGLILSLFRKFFSCDIS